MHSLAIYRLKLESEMRRVLERSEFRLYYQPIVSLSDGRFVGFEALIRWERPVVGLISPGEFITTAEETGLIIPIGQWVLGQACESAHSWNSDLSRLTPLTICVNISARQFAQPGESHFR